MCAANDIETIDMGIARKRRYEESFFELREEIISVLEHEIGLGGFGPFIDSNNEVANIRIWASTLLDLIDDLNSGIRKHKKDRQLVMKC